MLLWHGLTRSEPGSTDREMDTLTIVSVNLTERAEMTSYDR